MFDLVGASSPVHGHLIAVLATWCQHHASTSWIVHSGPQVYHSPHLKRMIYGLKPVHGLRQEGQPDRVEIWWCSFKSSQSSAEKGPTYTKKNTWWLAYVFTCLQLLSMTHTYLNSSFHGLLWGHPGATVLSTNPELLNRRSDCLSQRFFVCLPGAPLLYGGEMG